jgi:hypothetical protein
LISFTVERKTTFFGRVLWKIPLEGGLGVLCLISFNGERKTTFFARVLWKTPLKEVWRYFV